MSSRKFIVTFHGIGEPAEHIAPDERDVWVGREMFVAIVDVCAQAKADGVDVEVMFDDGNRSDLEIAMPVLQERNLQGTFFIVADRIGKQGYLDDADLRVLRQAGMAVGCHGMRHVPWSGLTGDQLHEELVNARDRIEQAVGEPITRAACPFGAYNRQVVSSLKNAGYTHMYTSDRGWTRPNALIQARNTVHHNDDGQSVQAWLNHPTPLLESIQTGARRWAKRWR